MPNIIEFLGYAPFELTNKTIGDKIMIYIKVNRLSQKKLARLLSADQTSVRDWESNKNKPCKKLLNRISKVLNVAT